MKKNNRYFFIFKRIQKIKNEITCLFSIFYRAYLRESFILIQYLLIFNLIKILRYLFNKWFKGKYLFSQLSGIGRHPVVVWFQRRELLRLCITYRCNASCEVCYSRGLTKEFPEDMSLENFIYLVRWAKRLGWPKFMFLGGEPTFHPYFKEFLDICYKEKMGIILSTNGLFGEDILRMLKLPYIESICLDYLEGQINNSNYKNIFFYNLDYLKQRNFNIVLSGVIDGTSEKWRETIDIAQYFNLSIKWSLKLPGFGGNCFPMPEFIKPETFGQQLMEILKVSKEKKVFSFVYRPVLLCMFSSKEINQIQELSKYIIFTRCVLGYRGDYTLALTVNPDLSIYPCNNLFIKGPSIREFKHRESINKYFRKVVKNILSIPPSDRCADCNYFKNFQSLLKDEKLLCKKDKLFSKDICQAGCVDFRRQAREVKR